VFRNLETNGSPFFKYDKALMKRLLPIFLALFLITLLAIFVRQSKEKQRQIELEIGYQATLWSYQEFLKPGNTKRNRGSAANKKHSVSSDVLHRP
jgi:hypothetical protein